jgi:cytochrome c peroxidase
MSSTVSRFATIRLVALVTGGVALLALTLAAATAPRGASAAWTADERALLRSLSLSALEKLPADPSNKYADDPAAMRLGAELFFDTRLSANGRVSCASCHAPDKGFQDGLPLGKGVGTAGRRTMPIAGTAYSPWQFWDGRADSHWAQALGPFESPAEHGGDRVQYAHVMREHYKDAYEAVFGALPDLRGLPERAGPVPDSARSRAWAHIAPVRQKEISHLYANIGKAIAAYERTIAFTPARFDRFVDAELAGRQHTRDDAFSDDERAGLRLFIGKANCSTCHNGSLLTDNHFHNTGVPQSTNGAANDSGRATGVRAVMASEFNCVGPHSDAKRDDCSELRFAVTEGSELVRAFKTPSLRNAVTRPPFMHAGQFTSIAEVLAHYNRAPSAPAGKTELKRLRLSENEMRQIEAFLNTLVSPVDFPRRATGYATKALP